MEKLKSISRVLLLLAIYWKKVGLFLFLMVRETIMFFITFARELRLKKRKNIFLKNLLINIIILINLPPMTCLES